MFTSTLMLREARDFIQDHTVSEKQSKLRPMDEVREGDIQADDLGGSGHARERDPQGIWWRTRSG